MTLNLVGGRHGRHGPSGRLLLLSEVSANVNLAALDYSEVTFDIAGFTLWLLFVSFTKALLNADFKCYDSHNRMSCLAGVSDWAAW